MENKGTFYFIKIDTTFFERHDMKILRSQPQGDSLLLFYLMLCTESTRHNGNLRYSELIPYDSKTLSIVFSFELAFIEMALKIFESMELIQLLDNQTIFVTMLEKLTRSSSSAKRVAKHRELKRLEQAREDKCNNVTLHVTEYRDKSIENRNKSIENRNKKKKLKSETIPIYFENENLNSKYLEFLEMRKQMKKKATQVTMNQNIKLLNKYDVDTAISIIDTSLNGGYLGLFAPKETNKINNNQKIIGSDTYWQDKIENQPETEEDIAYLEEVKKKFATK